MNDHDDAHLYDADADDILVDTFFGKMPASKAGVRSTRPTLNDFEKSAISEAKSADAKLKERVALQEAQSLLERKTAAFDALGADTFENGDIVAFTKQWTTLVCTYAAIKANDRWYVTGMRAPNNVTWDNFKLWLVSDINPVIHLERMVPESLVAELKH